MWYPLYVSVKDRWVGTLFIGPVSLVAYRQQRVDLPPLFQWLTWKRNWVQTHGLVSRCAVDYVENPFLENSSSVHRY
jgi:hypothetical protein